MIIPMAVCLVLRVRCEVVKGLLETQNKRITPSLIVVKNERYEKSQLQYAHKFPKVLSVKLCDAHVHTLTPKDS